MAYATPQLTLIGHAAGVVLGHLISGVFKAENADPKYDATAFLETEW